MRASIEAVLIGKSVRIMLGYDAERNLVAKQSWKKTRKAVCISTEPVPQTDTGRQEEDSKANGRRVVKELGKLTP